MNEKELLKITLISNLVKIKSNVEWWSNGGPVERDAANQVLDLAQNCIDILEDF